MLTILATVKENDHLPDFRTGGYLLPMARRQEQDLLILATGRMTLMATPGLEGIFQPGSPHEALKRWWRAVGVV